MRCRSCGEEVLAKCGCGEEPIERDGEFARLRARVAELEARLDEAGTALGAVVVAGTLQPGESLIDPPVHASISAIIGVIGQRDEAFARVAELEAENRRLRGEVADLMIHRQGACTCNGMGDCDWCRTPCSRCGEHRIACGCDGGPTPRVRTVVLKMALLPKGEAMLEATDGETTIGCSIGASYAEDRILGVLDWLHSPWAPAEARIAEMLSNFDPCDVSPEACGEEG